MFQEKAYCCQFLKVGKDVIIQDFTSLLRPRPKFGHAMVNILIRL